MSQITFMIVPTRGPGTMVLWQIKNALEVFCSLNWRGGNNNNNVYFKSLSYTNVLFKLEMNAQQNKIFW
jgi:hypothetical protein